MSNVSRITAANGGGMGPEIMSACLHVIRENGAARIEPSAGESLRRTMDAYRCRFSAKGGTTAKQTVALRGRVLDQGVAIVKAEPLRAFDGKAGYTLAQGQ